MAISTSTGAFLLSGETPPRGGKNPPSKGAPLSRAIGQSPESRNGAIVRPCTSRRKNATAPKCDTYDIVGRQGPVERPARGPVSTLPRKPPPKECCSRKGTAPARAREEQHAGRRFSARPINTARRSGPALTVDQQGKGNAASVHTHEKKNQWTWQGTPRSPRTERQNSGSSKGKAVFLARLQDSPDAHQQAGGERGISGGNARWSAARTIHRRQWSVRRSTRRSASGRDGENTGATTEKPHQVRRPK